MLLAAFLTMSINLWAETISFDASTHVTASTTGTGYVAGPSELTLNGSTWTATGYRTVANTSVIIGSGGANYLQTPELNGNISSIEVTWSGNTSHYLALQTTSGTELEAKSNPSTATSATFTISEGNYTQLRLVGRRSTGTSNAAATITAITVTYSSSAKYTDD